MKDTETRPNQTCFYFEFVFDNKPNVMLCYDYNYYFTNQFEICYADNHSDVIWKGVVKTKQHLEKVVLENLK